MWLKNFHWLSTFLNMKYSLKMEFASENSLEWLDTFSWLNEPVQWVFLNPWYGVDWDLFCVKCQVFSYATSPFLTVIYIVIFIMFIYFLFAYRKIIEVLTYKSRHPHGIKWDHLKCGRKSMIHDNGGLICLIVPRDPDHFVWISTRPRDLIVG